MLHDAAAALVERRALMRVLVTGGAGFVGSHVVDDLLAAGHDVVSFDSLHPAAHRGPPPGLAPEAEYRWADLGDECALVDAVRGVDAVSHQAAMVGLGLDFADVVAYAQANDLGTACLLRALDAVGFRGPFVLASSMVVYGEGGYACRVHGAVSPGDRNPERLARAEWEPTCPICCVELVPHPVVESAPLDPRSVYAATKLHQEHLCAVYGRDHGAPVIALRYHNVYGPRMPRDTPYAGVASIFRSAVEAGRPPTVFEDGGQRRDFVHVRDVARANRLALDRGDGWSGALNVASGSPHTVLDLATSLTRALGGDRPVIEPRFRSGDVRHVFASPERAAQVLGFRAGVNFDEGIAAFARAPLRG
jgi:dTDP-L-rhamnose 4-epimerase